MKIMNIVNKYNIIMIFLIILMCVIIFLFQAKKEGFHEDEAYSIVSSVNANNGLMSAYQNNDFPENESPEWKTKEYVKNFATLSSENYFNFASVYNNQCMDNHPPVFYIFAHISSILFGGQFTKYSIFLVNIIAFILSCIVINKILKILNKNEISIPILILYGLSMGTISMVLYQRMYMLLTLFILLYFYYTIKIYKNNFILNRNIIIKLGVVAILGFLTQYFFAIYAVGIFLVMIIKMKKENKIESLKKYILIHIIYSALGILLFPYCIYHLFFTSRGISNLANSNYFANLVTYIKYLTYSFTIKESTLILLIGLVLIFIRLMRMHKEDDEKFIILLIIIPSLIFFLITIKLTSFQELRYILPMIPFIVIATYFILDKLIDIKYKKIIFIGISIILVLHGFISSSPKYLYENYKECINIAKENSEKSFVYIYDNFFNHMQSIPEMMIYNKTLIINNNKNELEYLIKDEELNKENSYILCIKSYMNNDEILDRIKNETEFNNITVLCTSGCGHNDEQVENNLYLVSK